MTKGATEKAPASKAGLLPPTMTKVLTHHGRGRKPLGVSAPYFVNVGDCKSKNLSINKHTKMENKKKSYTYHPQYGIVVMCTDEQNQIDTFNRLKELNLGLKLKVVTV